MASISARTFRWAGFEVVYNRHGERTLRYDAAHANFWMMLEDDKIVSSYRRSTRKSKWTGESTDIPAKMLAAMWHAARREGFLGPDLPEVYPGQFP